MPDFGEVISPSTWGSLWEGGMFSWGVLQIRPEADMLSFSVFQHMVNLDLAFNKMEQEALLPTMGFFYKHPLHSNS